MNIYTIDDLYKIISEIKQFTPKGNPIIIHESISSIGFIKEPHAPKKKLALWLNILEEELRGYPWAMATFNYDFPKTKSYKRSENLSQLGALSKLICKKYPNNRTLDPIFSYVLMGDMDYWHKLNLLNGDPILHPFRENSFFHMINDTDATFIALGLLPDYDIFLYGFTFLHYIEEKLNIGYRYNKLFNGAIDDQQVTYSFRVRPTFINEVTYKNELKQFANLIKIGTDSQENNHIALFKMDLLTNYLTNAIKKDELSLFSDETIKEIKEAQKTHTYPFIE